MFAEHLPCARNLATLRNKAMNGESGSNRTYKQKMDLKQVILLCSEYFRQDNTENIQQGDLNWFRPPQGSEM